MFQFVKSGSPMPVVGDETRIMLVEWFLPAALGGERRWALDQDSDLDRDGVVYFADHPVESMEFPPSSSQISEEHGTMTLADPDRVWRDLVGDLYAGVRIKVSMILLSGGGYSDNSMHLFTGYGYGARPTEQRMLELDFANEIGRLDADVGRRMTPQEQRRKDEDDNSLDYVASAITFKWGLKEQSRRNN